MCDSLRLWTTRVAICFTVFTNPRITYMYVLLCTMCTLQCANCCTLNEKGGLEPNFISLMLLWPLTGGYSYAEKKHRDPSTMPTRSTKSIVFPRVYI